MNPLSWLYLIILLVGLLPFLGLVTILQVALSRIRGENLERLVQRQVPGARRLDNLLRHSGSLSLSVSLAEGASVVGTVILVAAVIGEMGLSLRIGALIAGGIGLAIFVAMRILAYAMAWETPETAALRLNPLARVLVAGFGPPAALVARFGTRSKNGTTAPADETSPTKEPQNGEGLTIQGHEVEEHEREMIRAILQLEDTHVREIMVPFPDIIAADHDTPFTDVISLVNEHGYSRIPLFEGNKDNIVGVVYAKDLLALPEDRQPMVTLKDISRQPFYIPETKRLDELLREFQERRVHIGIVVDEYGAVSGLVTIEDLLEEIVGEITDEYDSGEPEVERISDTEAIIDGKAPLDMLNELFEIEIQGSGFDTIGGLVFHQLGKIPNPGDVVTEDGVRLDVLTTAGRRIRKVRVTRVAAPSNGNVD